jgi:nucleotide-binding universal stress UspA family protein
MKILVAFDGSDQSYRAFDFAVDYLKMCSGAGADIMVLSVAQPPEPADIVEVDAVIDSATEHYEELFRGLRERAKAQNIDIKTGVVIGHPADQIVRYAADNQCDMIVIGPRGKSKIETWLLGSVSKRVTSYAQCTVVIVK